MKIKIYQKPGIDEEKIISEISRQCKKYNFELVKEDCDVVFYIGGDGTFLRAVHDNISRLKDILFVGINVGNLGFFYDGEYEDLERIFSALSKNDYKVYKYPLIKGHINNHDVFAVNEIRIENPFHTLVSDVFVNNTKMETFRGSGLLVSSPIGSSAYNRSLGGAIVDPSLEVLQVTEIAPICHNGYSSLSSSLVLPKDTKVCFEADFSEVVIGNDHMTYSDKKAKDIVISLSDIYVSVIRVSDFNYIDKLKKSFIR